MEKGVNTMKTKSITLEYIAVASMVMTSIGMTLCSPVFAGGTSPLTVNAKISGVCKVTAAPATLDFGSIDPSGGANATASTTFTMKCSNGTTSTAASDDGGLNFSGTKRLQHTVAGNFLGYAIAYSNDTGFSGAGFGGATASQTVTINGTITPAQYGSALATTGVQVYSDTVTITVNP